MKELLWYAKIHSVQIRRRVSGFVEAIEVGSRRAQFFLVVEKMTVNREAPAKATQRDYCLSGWVELVC